MTAEADRMARAREEFTEAMARGCSIPELRRIKARERQIEAEARLEARRNCGRRISEKPGAGTVITPVSAPQGAGGRQAPDFTHRSPFLDGQELRNEPWMMRD